MPPIANPVSETWRAAGRLLTGRYVSVTPGVILYTLLKYLRGRPLSHYDLKSHKEARHLAWPPCWSTLRLLLQPSWSKPLLSSSREPSLWEPLSQSS